MCNVVKVTARTSFLDVLFQRLYVLVKFEVFAFRHFDA